MLTRARKIVQWVGHMLCMQESWHNVVPKVLPGEFQSTELEVASRILLSNKKKILTRYSKEKNISWAGVIAQQ